MGRRKKPRGLVSDTGDAHGKKAAVSKTQFNSRDVEKYYWVIPSKHEEKPFLGFGKFEEKNFVCRSILIKSPFTKKGDATTSFNVPLSKNRIEEAETVPTDILEACVFRDASPALVEGIVQEFSILPQDAAWHLLFRACNELSFKWVAFVVEYCERNALNFPLFRKSVYGSSPFTISLNHWKDPALLEMLLSEKTSKLYSRHFFANGFLRDMIVEREHRESWGLLEREDVIYHLAEELSVKDVLFLGTEFPELSIPVAGALRRLVFRAGFASDELEHPRDLSRWTDDYESTKKAFRFVFQQLEAENDILDYEFISSIGDRLLVPFSVLGDYALFSNAWKWVAWTLRGDFEILRSDIPTFFEYILNEICGAVVNRAMETLQTSVQPSVLSSSKAIKDTSLIRYPLRYYYELQECQDENIPTDIVKRIHFLEQSSTTQHRKILKKFICSFYEPDPNLWATGEMLDQNTIIKLVALNQRDILEMIVITAQITTDVVELTCPTYETLLSRLVDFNGWKDLELFPVVGQKGAPFFRSDTEIDVNGKLEMYMYIALRFNAFPTLDWLLSRVRENGHLSYLVQERLFACACLCKNSDAVLWLLSHGFEFNVPNLLSICGRRALLDHPKISLIVLYKCFVLDSPMSRLNIGVALSDCYMKMEHHCERLVNDLSQATTIAELDKLKIPMAEYFDLCSEDILGSITKRMASAIRTPIHDLNKPKTETEGSVHFLRVNWLLEQPWFPRVYSKLRLMRKKKGSSESSEQAMHSLNWIMGIYAEYRRLATLIEDSFCQGDVRSSLYHAHGFFTHVGNVLLEDYIVTYTCINCDDEERILSEYRDAFFQRFNETYSKLCLFLSIPKQSKPQLSTTYKIAGYPVPFCLPAEEGDISMISELRNNVIVTDLSVFNGLLYAAQGGHLDVIQLLHKFECPFNSSLRMDALATALENGNLEVVAHLGGGLLTETHEIAYYVATPRYANKKGLTLCVVNDEPKWISSGGESSETNVFKERRFILSIIDWYFHPESQVNCNNERVAAFSWVVNRLPEAVQNGPDFGAYLFSLVSQESRPELVVDLLRVSIPKSSKYRHAVEPLALRCRLAHVVKFFMQDYGVNFSELDVEVVPEDEHEFSGLLRLQEREYAHMEQQIRLNLGGGEFRLCKFESTDYLDLEKTRFPSWSMGTILHLLPVFLGGSEQMYSAEPFISTHIAVDKLYKNANEFIVTFIHHHQLYKIIQETDAHGFTPAQIAWSRGIDIERGIAELLGSIEGATKIQALVRSRKCHLRFKYIRTCIVRIQACARGYKTRVKYKPLLLPGAQYRARLMVIWENFIEQDWELKQVDWTKMHDEFDIMELDDETTGIDDDKLDDDVVETLYKKAAKTEVARTPDTEASTVGEVEEQEVFNLQPGEELQEIKLNGNMESIRITHSVLKWFQNQDPKYAEMFIRRLRQLASGERSRILAKALVGSKLQIYETYLDQSTAQRIIWTECCDEGKYYILIWYVLKHKWVSRYMNLIDRSYFRLQKRSETMGANVLTDDMDKENGVLLMDGNRMLADPRRNTPLKLYQIKKNDLPELESIGLSKSWRPPLRLTNKERDIVEKPGTVLLLGRSGTGKTMCVVNRMSRDRHLNQLPGFKQLFVARNQKVTSLVENLTVVSFLNESELEGVEFHTFDNLLKQTLARLSEMTKTSNHFPLTKRIDYGRFKLELFPRMTVGKKCHLAPLIVWTQIKSFLKGSILAITKERSLTEEEYLALPANQCKLNEAQRKEAYGLFQMYEVLCKEHRCWDDCDRVYRTIELLGSVPRSGSGGKGWLATSADGAPPNTVGFHKVYIDEGQDFTTTEIALLFLLCGNTRSLFLCGDNAQSIEDGVDFRFEEVRSIVFHLTGSQQAMIERPVRLNVNYRSHGGILVFAAAILDRMFLAFPNSADKTMKDEGLFSGPKPSLLEMKSGPSEIKRLTDQNEKIFVITPENNVQALQDLLGENRIVLSIKESKGLEFQYVAVVDFFCTMETSLHKAWKELFSKEGHALDFSKKAPEIERHLKLFYTAVTRCASKLMIIETKQNNLTSAFFRWAERENLCERFNWQLEEERSVLTTEEWKRRGLDFVLNENDYDVSWLTRAKACFASANAPELVEKMNVQIEARTLRAELYTTRDVSVDKHHKISVLVEKCLNIDLAVEASRLVQTILELGDDRITRFMRVEVLPKFKGV
mmetsp:Transcript_36528/g.58913  ORF Transcript_36528/g.58913 Transcript_36528/m.58913 type:complete len:2195 (-) Transcript_36528:219-6803(-)